MPILTPPNPPSGTEPDPKWPVSRRAVAQLKESFGDCEVMHDHRICCPVRTLRLALSLAVMAVLSVGQGLNFEAAERQIVRLPPTAFPTLPIAVVRELQHRGCTVPQESFSKPPNNLISGQFAKRGQTDWAVLCSIKGSSSILVFWNGSASNPAELARREDKIYLQSLVGDKIGFSRGISAVGKDFIVQRYLAAGGPKPPPIDHQGINDAFLGKASVVQYFFKGQWLELPGDD